MSYWILINLHPLPLLIFRTSYKTGLGIDGTRSTCAQCQTWTAWKQGKCLLSSCQLCLRQLHSAAAPSSPRNKEEFHGRAERRNSWKSQVLPSKVRSGTENIVLRSCSRIPSACPERGKSHTPTGYTTQTIINWLVSWLRMAPKLERSNLDQGQGWK